MDNNKTPDQNENISEFLELLKQTCSTDNESIGDIEPVDDTEANVVEISLDDLQKMLKNTYSVSKESEYSSGSDQTYDIDENFLESAKADTESEEELIEESEEELVEESEEEFVEESEEELVEESEEEFVEEPEEELIEEPEEELVEESEEELDEFAYLAALDEVDDEPLTAEDIEMLKALADQDEELTYGDLAEVEQSDNGLTMIDLPLDAVGASLDDDANIADEATFDDIVENPQLDDNEENIVYMPISLEGESEDDGVEWYEDEKNSLDQAEATAIDSEAVDSAEEQSVSFDEPEMLGAEQTVDGDLETVIDEIAGEPTEHKPRYQVSSAELALLLQLGCDEEIFELASDEDIENIAIEESLDSIPEDTDDDFGRFEESENHDGESNVKKTLNGKILSVYEGYHKSRGEALLRLLITASLGFLLLLYEGLPLIGVRLPGIMDRKEFFLSYVLIGLQLLVICLIPSYKQLYGGIKKLFSKTPNAYSMIALLAILTLIYDISILSVKIVTPHVFHLLLALLLAAVVAGECVSISMQMKTYKYFFGGVIDSMQDGADDESAKEDLVFTLKKSSGKNSTAEKMYAGGLDPSMSVYYPLQTDSVAGYFNALSGKNRRGYAPLFMMLPVLAVCVIAGILALVLPDTEKSAWACFAVMLTSLFLTLPITTVVSGWLPFELFNMRNMEQGFAFVEESGVQGYCDCKVFTFKDTHVFEKCSSASVNLATYDTTASNVLIGCLDAVYSKIGGPLKDVFSFGEEYAAGLGECTLRRIAKSGVEAMVGNNYCVLLGNEQFMARYGISFPKVNFKNPDDEMFSLCLSINGRASARIVAQYKVNEMFEMLAFRLAEDGIYCAVETYDPMVSSALLTRLRAKDSAALSVVHLGIEDHESTRHTYNDGVMFGLDEAKCGVIAKNSRLNLVVAACGAKRMKKLRDNINILCYSLMGVGFVVSCLNLGFNWIENMNEFCILLFWLLCAGAMSAMMFLGLPKRGRFTLDSYRADLSQKRAKQKNKK